MFWEAVDQNPALRAHKEHFYSNGIEYSTEIDVFLLCRAFGICYLVAGLAFNHIFLLSTGGILILIALISRYVAIPRARQHHLDLSDEQLGLLKREMVGFVVDRFRQIVVSWRTQGRPVVNLPSNESTILLHWKEALAVLSLLIVVIILGLVGRKWFGQGPGVKRNHRGQIRLHNEWDAQQVRGGSRCPRHLPVQQTIHGSIMGVVPISPTSLLQIQTSKTEWMFLPSSI